MRKEWCLNRAHRKSARLGNIFECNCSKYPTEKVIDIVYVERIRKINFLNKFYAEIKA